MDTLDMAKKHEAPAAAVTRPFGHIPRLTDPEFAPALAEFKRRLTDEPGFARKMLREAGITTAKGKVKKIYGG